MNLIPAGSNNQMLSASELYNLLEDKLKNKAVGYAFVISYKEAFANGSSGGFCRLTQDSPSRPMTVFEMYNCASVSKPISAAALMLLLYHKTGVGRNSSMWEYLPAHWKIGPGVKTITFLELLTHNSGFRESARTYHDLKKVIEEGINEHDKTDSYYLNTNYALLRLIIPKLAGYPVKSLKDKSILNILLGEPSQAVEFAKAYIDYCKKNLFDKLGTMNDVDCNQNSVEPRLFYSFSDQTLPGKNMGDQTLNAGSGGWVMSTLQMAHFFRTLHHTKKIMPFELSKKLREEHLGYGLNTSAGVNNYYKSGSENIDGREFSSLIMLFDNGVQFAMMTTSHLSLKQLAWDAFTEWYH